MGGADVRARLCITSSMTDAVIVDLTSRHVPGIDVLFLDTGYHFAETIGTRDAVSAVYPVNVINVTPPTTVAEQDAELGPKLYAATPTCAATCARSSRSSSHSSRTTPGSPGCAGRRPTPGRDTRVVQWDARRQMVKVNPIVEWTQQEVDDYIAEQRRARQPAGLRRLPVDRLPHLHRPGRGRRRSAQRPLGGHGQDRVRYPHLIACRLAL